MQLRKYMGLIAVIAVLAAWLPIANAMPSFGNLAGFGAMCSIDIDQQNFGLVDTLQQTTFTFNPNTIAGNGNFIVTYVSPAPSQQAQPLEVYITPAAAQVTSGKSITLTAIASGGIPSYLYTWYTTNTAGICSSSDAMASGSGEGATFTITPTQSAYYCVIVKDSNGNTASSKTIPLTMLPENYLKFNGNIYSFTPSPSNYPASCTDDVEQTLPATAYPLSCACQGGAQYTSSGTCEGSTPFSLLPPGDTCVYKLYNGPETYGTIQAGQTVSCNGHTYTLVSATKGTVYVSGYTVNSNGQAGPEEAYVYNDIANPGVYVVAYETPFTVKNTGAPTFQMGTAEISSKVNILSSSNPQATQPSQPSTQSSPTSAAAVNTMPLVSSIADYNNANAGGLITCPIPPNALNTSEYFEQDIQNKDAQGSGNLCIVNGSNVPNSMVFSACVTTHWSAGVPVLGRALSLYAFNFSTPGGMFIYDYGFSPQAVVNTSPSLFSTVSPIYPTAATPYSISSSYNSNSYVFQSPSAGPQKALWGWSAVYANFTTLGNKLKGGKTVLSNQFSNLHESIIEPQYIGKSLVFLSCVYPYTYNVILAISNIKAANIPIPGAIPLTSGNYFMFNGIKYPFVQQSTSYNHGEAINGEYVSYACKNNAEYGTYFGTNCYSQADVFDYGTNYQTCAYQLFNGPPVGNDMITCDGITYTLVSNTVKGIVYYNGYTSAPVYAYYKGSDTGNYIVSYMTPYIATSTSAPTFAIGTASIPSIPFKNVTALPYILYNLSMPSTMSDVSNKESYLNLSFDMYSPHNFLSPDQYLDPFIINTSDGFFANYSGTLGELPFDSISAQSLNGGSFSSRPLAVFYSTVTNTLLNEQISYFGPDFAKEVFGSNYGILQGGSLGFVYSAISNPIAIEATPNDYVYVMTGSKDAVNVYVFRFIPAGYYNMSNYQPSSIPNVTSEIFSPSDCANALSQWTNTWENYWKETMAIQSSDLYMIGVIRITSSAISGSFGSVPSINADGFHFVPTAMAVDYTNDLFFVGQESGRLAIGYILSNGTTGYDSDLHFTGSSSPITLIPYEIAVSPGGQYIFVALSKYADSAKNIAIFSARNFSFIGNISLSYSTPEYNMNIVEYLEAGGPYPSNPGASSIASSYSNIPTTAASSTVSIVSNDIEAYHNPIAMYDEDGILYVLDNWSFTSYAPTQCETSNTGTQCHMVPMSSSILMLRAFFDNGTEVPIDAMHTSDIVPNSAYQGNIMLLSYPPYGWPLSATISIWQNNQVKQITYCAVGNNGGKVGCNYTPLSLAAISSNSLAYLPIGPELSPTPSGKQNTKVYFGVNFNDTAYLWSSFSYSEAGKSKVQNTIVAFKVGIINYTKLSLMQDMPYSCYVNSSLPSSSGATAPTSSQSYNAYNSNCLLSSSLASMSPPVLGVPSSFLYTESQGSPEDYLTLPSVINSLHPFSSSGSSYSTEANSINNNGCSGITTSSQTSQCSETPSSLSQSYSSQAASSLPPEYINSFISGYLLLPYNLTYSFTQQWEYSNADSATGCPTSVTSQGCQAFCYPGSIFNGAYTANYVQYGTVQLNAWNDSSNITVQSGSIYLANPTDLQDLYIPNMSDASLIVPPRLAYTVLSNRLFGEIIINQSVNSTGSVLFPMKVLNQSNIYNYHIAQYTQNYGNGKTFNGFETEVAKYMAPVVTSPNTLSNPYYYAYDPSNPAYVYLYNHTLQYSNASLVNPGVFPQIYNTFSRMAYQYNLTLTFLSSNSLGYNRFIYTFVDAFNNTINVPIDVDLANQTQIFLNMTNVTVSPGNANQTTINVGGYAMAYMPNNLYALAPLPKNSLIYIYYNNNINFANAFNQKASTFNAVQADLCAFSSNAVGCLLANPLNATEATGAALWSDNINYYPNYNITGACPKEPNSMISNSILASLFECNIYGEYGLPATETVNGHTRYCIPAFLNGTGTLTSQLGLVAILHTDANGYFSYTFNACGASIPKITAAYYGWPPPATYLQPALGEAMETLNPYALVPTQPVQEYNYSYMPSQVAYSVQIGSYALSFGYLYAPVAMAVTAIAAALVLWRSSAKNKGKAKANKQQIKKATNAKH